MYDMSVSWGGGLEANKVDIVREGAVPPLLSLSHSIDIKVQRNAAGALLNLTHIGALPTHPPHPLTAPPVTPFPPFPLLESNRHVLVEAGAISVFVQLLDSSDEDVQFYCAAALSNLAVHGKSLFSWQPKGVADTPLPPLESYRKVIVTSGEGRALRSLIKLMQPGREKVSVLSKGAPKTCKVIHRHTANVASYIAAATSLQISWFVLSHDLQFDVEPGQCCHTLKPACVLLPDGREARHLGAQLVVPEDLEKDLPREDRGPVVCVPSVVLHHLVPDLLRAFFSDDLNGQHQSPDSQLGGQQATTLRGNVAGLDEVLCEVVDGCGCLHQL